MASKPDEEPVDEESGVAGERDVTIEYLDQAERRCGVRLLDHPEE